MSADYEVTIADDEKLAQVIAGLCHCHGHHFAVYVDERAIIGSELAITECVPRLLAEEE
jgi:hypothetical protein